MSNSLQEQGLAAAGQSHSLNTRSTIDEFDRMRQESQAASEAAQQQSTRFQAVAQYMSSGAEQEKAQGKSLVQAGNLKTSMGMGFIAIGAAVMAIPMLGPSLGFPMMVKGMEQVALGAVDRQQGNGMLQRAQEKLNEATNNEILGKQEAVVSRKEIARSQIFERKMKILEQMLKEVGIENRDLSEPEIQKIKAAFEANFDKFMGDAAKALANGGVMEIDGLKDANGKDLGLQYFIKDEDDGKFYKVNAARDENGEPILGASGEPLLDWENGATQVEDGELLDLLKVKFRFVDELKNLAQTLTTTEVDGTGNIKLVPYDLNNADHMREFADLVLKSNVADVKSGRTPGPLKYTIEAGVEYFQEWDWSKDIPIGPKTPVDDLYGGKFDRGDIESYQLAIERSQNALGALGLNAGGSRFNLLSRQGYTGLSSQSTTDRSSLDATSRNSDAFKQFNTPRATIDAIRGNSVLDGSAPDDLPPGQG